MQVLGFFIIFVFETKLILKNCFIPPPNTKSIGFFYYICIDRIKIVINKIIFHPIPTVLGFFIIFVLTLNYVVLKFLINKSPPPNINSIGFFYYICIDH